MMTNWSRLILPLGLGLAAAMINASAVRARIEPHYLTAVNRVIASGDMLREADLVQVPVPANPGNERHFWSWKDRQQLLGGVTAAVELQPGDLIPREPFLRAARPRFEIPKEHVVICLRLSETQFSGEHLYQLRPGRPVSVKLRHPDTTAPQPLQQATLAFLEPSPIGEKREGSPDTWQIGLIVRNHPGDLQRLFENGVASIAGAGE
jgi:hypothetical protein